MLQVRGYYVAAGMNTVGISLCSGVGKVMAEWISKGEPPGDLGVNDICRFAQSLNNLSFLGHRVSDYHCK